MCMFSTISKIITFFKNKEKISLAVATIYDSVRTVIDTLEFIEKETNDTKLGKTLQQYLPNVLSVLGKIREIIEKYGKYVGFVPSNVETQGEKDHGQALKDSAQRLNKLL